MLARGVNHRRMVSLDDIKGTLKQRKTQALFSNVFDHLKWAYDGVF